MKFSIKYSKLAMLDLERIWDEVLSASASVEVTAGYVEALLALVEGQADFPESGAPLYYEDTFTGYRFVVYKAYIAFYRTEGTAIFVDRILHSKSDYLRVLGL